MTTYHLNLTLKSDATFGRGDGVAGVVDEEIEHDPRTGLPFVRGRTLRGLLVEECANILFAIELRRKDKLVSDLKSAAKTLFGEGGPSHGAEGCLSVGAAVLPEPLREAITGDIDAGRLTPSEVLTLLTDIRRQTAMTAEGTPQDGSLRSMRVLLRATTLTAPLIVTPPPKDQAEIVIELLTATVLSLRRGGIGRNRGRGRLHAILNDEAFSKVKMAAFDKRLLPKEARP